MANATEEPTFHFGYSLDEILTSHRFRHTALEGNALGSEVDDSQPLWDGQAASFIGQRDPAP